MFKKIISVFSLALLVGCDSAPSQNTSDSLASPSASNASGGGSLMTLANQSTELTSRQDPHYATYNVENWEILATEEWAPLSSSIPNTKIGLSNQNQQLLATLLIEDTKKSQEDYSKDQVASLTKLTGKSVESKTVTVYENQFTFLDAQDAGYNRWQWILVKGDKAHVWGCGSPKGVNPNLDTCLDLIRNSKMH